MCLTCTTRESSTCVVHLDSIAKCGTYAHSIALLEQILRELACVKLQKVYRFSVEKIRC